MDRFQYHALCEAVSPMGYEVYPEPEVDENLASFEITSDETPILHPSDVINAIYRPSLAAINFRVLGIQSNKITFADLDAAPKI